MYKNILAVLIKISIVYTILLYALNMKHRTYKICIYATENFSLKKLCANVCKYMRTRVLFSHQFYTCMIIYLSQNINLFLENINLETNLQTQCYGSI